MLTAVLLKYKIPCSNIRIQRPLKDGKNQWSRQYTKQKFPRTENLCSHSVYSWQKEEGPVKGKRERLLAQEVMMESSMCSSVISNSAV